MEKKNKELCDIKNTLTRWVGSEVDKGKAQCCPTYEETKIMGEIIDMIKDIGEAEKNYMESCYYKSVVEAMEKSDERQDKNGKWDDMYKDVMGYVLTHSNNDDPMGYNSRRYPSSGRYASAGHGEMMGYTPTYMRDSMGYMNGDDRITRYGYSYDQYRDARRHYTETHSPEEKKRMNDHATEHLNDTITTMRDIWRDADPELKTRMKNELTNLINEMV